MAGRHRRTPAQGRHRKPPPRGRVLLPALAVAAVLGVGGVGASAALSGNGPSQHLRPGSTGPQSSGPGSTAGSPMPLRYPATSQSSPAAVPTVAGTPPTSALPDFAISVVRGVSWVQVIAPHGRVLYAGMLRHGHTLTYPQRPLTVTIGDAGVVRLVLHHHAQSPAGRRGEVLRLVLR